MNGATVGLCVLALLVGQGSALAQSRIEYKTVEEARTTLLAKPGVKSQDESGWLVVNDANVMWTFAPVNHEANPAVVRRQIIEQDGGLFIHTELLCEAAKAPCDRLNKTFQDLNAQMMKAMEEAAKSSQ
ncbi:MAG: hypothetical protein AB7S41_15630 [Parvibaculaceae bacterium]